MKKTIIALVFGLLFGASVFAADFSTNSLDLNLQAGAYIPPPANACIVNTYYACWLAYPAPGGISCWCNTYYGPAAGVTGYVY